MRTAELVMPDELERLRERLGLLERERKRLGLLVDLFRDIGACHHYVDIAQAVTQRLGQSFGLDRCSVFLTERDGGTVHLVASYEDPTIRNHVVDLARYPELRRALDTGQTVTVEDAPQDPAFAAVADKLTARRVKMIVVVPLVSKNAVIGALFLRTLRERPAITESEFELCRQVADLTTKALRNAHRFERLEVRKGPGTAYLRSERERAALLAFLRRLLVAFTDRDAAWNEMMLARTSAVEVDRLVDVALTVLSQEALTR